MNFCTPEWAGVPSAAVERFIARLEDNGLCMHSVAMARGETVFAEGCWAPITPDRKHRLYSSSKSFVSLAVGYLIEEGKLNLTDRVAGFFPDKLPEHPHPYTLMSTVRDLLRMATPNNRNAYGEDDFDWVKAFFHYPPDHVPGTVFSYDTAATVTLNAIVEKLTGMPFLEYLRPRLFAPLGVEEDIWCVERPDGGSWGGSGVMMTPRDLMKVAVACMQGGRWQGKQVIPAGYLCEATRKQIDTRTAERDPEWQAGYGYQFWVSRHNGFAMRGMGSQLAICLPEVNFVLVTTGDTQECPMGDYIIMNALWEEIYPHLVKNAGLPEDEVAASRLKARLDALHVRPEWGEMTAPAAGRISGVRYDMDENAMGIRWARFTVREDEIIMEYENTQGECSLRMGKGHVIEQAFPQKGYHGRRIGERLDRGYNCLASAAWADESSLTAHVWLTDDYFGSLKMHAVFKGDTVTLKMDKTAEWFLEEYQGFASGVRTQQ